MRNKEKMKQVHSLFPRYSFGQMVVLEIILRDLLSYELYKGSYDSGGRRLGGRKSVSVNAKMVER